MHVKHGKRVSKVSEIKILAFEKKCYSRKSASKKKSAPESDTGEITTIRAYFPKDQVVGVLYSVDQNNQVRRSQRVG